MSINSLPLETLGDIFHECVCNGSWPREESIRTPLRVSGVCHRWREVSLSLGVFWTYLDYSFYGRPHTSLIEILDAWLHRSKGTPLNFSFNCSLKHVWWDRETDEVAERAVLMLISHQWHWGKVKFIWRFRTSPSFSGIRLTNMPKLTLLNLYVKLNDGTYRGSGSIDLSRSSRLEHLRLVCPFSPFIGDKPMHLPAADTVDLELLSTPLTVPQCLDVLEAAPNLRKLRTVFCTVDDSSKYEDRPIISHNLQILSLWSSNASLILDKLDLPGLEGLLCTDRVVDNAGEIFSLFVERSLPPLLQLGIGGNCADEETVLAILPLLPLLEVLDMDPCTVSVQLFRLLSVPNSPSGGSRALDTRSQIVCPNLRWFCFWNYTIVGEPHECADAFCTMLESRWDALRMWNYLIDIREIHYPLSATDRERVEHYFRDMQDFGARSFNSEEGSKNRNYQLFIFA